MADKEKRQQILSEAIQRFAASPRYSFLRSLQVARFLAPDAEGLGVVSELTFEKLVELGSTKIAKLKWLTKDQETALTTLLKVLGETESNDATAALIIPPKRPNRLSPDYLHSDDEGLSSAEVENRLRDNLRKLSENSMFGEISRKTLGSFWDENWPRAPFEEAMTLGQLVDLDLAVLWKKRTTSSGRIDRMAKAVQTALAQLEAEGDTKRTPSLSTLPKGPANDETVAPRLAIVRQEVVRQGAQKRKPRTTLDVAVDKHPWVADENTLKPLERVGVRRLLEVLLKPEVRNDPVGQLAILMIDTLSPNDFTAVITQEWTIEAITPAISLWKALPEVAGYSSSLINSLSGPGTHIVALTKQCAVFGEDSEIGALVVTALVKMLGAKEVTVKGDQCRGVYSLNPFMLEAVLGTISEFDPKDPMRAVKVVIPVIDSHLSDWLREKLSVKQSK